MSVTREEWLLRLRDEYLRGFIPDGGSAVRVVVAEEAERHVALDAVCAAAVEEGYFVVRVDACLTRVHMMQEIFFAVAAQVDWDAEVDKYLRDLLSQQGIVMPEGIPLWNLVALAEANELPPSKLHGDMKRWVSNKVFDNKRLAREFRTAVTQLCASAISHDDVTVEQAGSVAEWLQGRKCSLSVLKKLQIFQRIGRHNARLLVHSLARWLHKAGYTGVCLVIDWSALEVHERGNGAISYSRAAVLDAYEVLRVFIDETDEAAHLLVLAFTGPGFTEDPRRGLDAYDALKLRLVNDVRGVKRDNPLNAMVRVASE
jgi:hypothetical protein